MCGITGFFETSGRTVDYETLRKMTQTLAHRGPDDAGYFLINSHGLDDGNWEQSRGNMGLGQRRLAILDLSPAGHQPMSTSDHKIWINFNGQIYNFAEIRAELMAKGYRFKSACDTEVIPYAYKAWGIDALHRFIGMFAISLWDDERKELILARDRLGIKPLYYYHKDGHFAFGSELKAILEYPNFEKEIDRESLRQYLAFQYIPGARTIYKNTHKLLPGHYLILDSKGQIKVKKYWDALDWYLPHLNGSALSEAEYLSELEKLLLSSVKYRMISDVPLGAFLSGGTDSSTVVALMQSLSNRPVKTFSIGFAEEAYNEAPYAKRVAQHLGTDHHEVYVTPKEAQAIIPKLPLFYDEPFADSSALPTYLVSKLARQQVTVALSGDGGDELFCGYTRYATMRNIAKYYRLPWAIRKTALFMADKIPAPLWDSSHRLLKPILPKALRVSNPSQKIATLTRLLQQEEATGIYSDLIRVWRTGDLKALTNDEADCFNLVLEETRCRLGEAELSEKLMLIDIKTYLVDDILTKVDRASMAVSLEARVPILDHRVVQFALQMPLQYKWNNGTQKYLLRKILYKYVPSQLFERPKQGFGVPLSEWFRGDLKYLLDSYLNEQRIRREGFFNPAVVAETVQKHLSGKYDHWHQLWALVSFEIWYERYGR